MLFYYQPIHVGSSTKEIMINQGLEDYEGVMVSQSSMRPTSLRCARSKNPVDKWSTTYKYKTAVRNIFAQFLEETGMWHLQFPCCLSCLFFLSFLHKTTFGHIGSPYLSPFFVPLSCNFVSLLHFILQTTCLQFTSSSSCTSWPFSTALPSPLLGAFPK